MPKTKARSITKLEYLVEGYDMDKMLQLLSNWMSSNELEEFVEFVKGEV